MTRKLCFGSELARRSLTPDARLAMGITNIAANPSQNIGIEGIEAAFWTGISPLWGTKLRMRL